MTRVDDVSHFYGLLGQLADQSGGYRRLSDAAALKSLPRAGVYFFFDADGFDGRGASRRVVRVGTHGLVEGSKSTLRQRLGQHRGTSNGGGNHRGSIFRLLVGGALLARGDFGPCGTWGRKGDLSKAALEIGASSNEIRLAENPIEAGASKYIGALPFVVLGIEDEAGPGSQRGRVERQAIALLSNHNRKPIHPQPDDWLGYRSDRKLVQQSGLWNQRHVDEDHDPAFLDAFERLVARQ